MSLEIARISQESDTVFHATLARLADGDATRVAVVTIELSEPDPTKVSCLGITY